MRQKYDARLVVSSALRSGVRRFCSGCCCGDDDDGDGDVVLDSRSGCLGVGWVVDRRVSRARMFWQRVDVSARARGSVGREERARAREAVLDVSAAWRYVVKVVVRRVGVKGVVVGLDDGACDCCCGVDRR